MYLKIVRFIPTVNNICLPFESEISGRRQPGSQFSGFAQRDHRHSTNIRQTGSHSSVAARKTAVAPQPQPTQNNKLPNTEATQQTRKQSRFRALHHLFYRHLPDFAGCVEFVLASKLLAAAGRLPPEPSSLSKPVFENGVKFTTLAH